MAVAVKMMFPLVLLAGGAPAPMAEPVQRHNDQTRVFEARREGRLLPLSEIEARIIPSMKGARYLGFVFESSSAVYTLKFLRDGTVIWVDVDGRSGQVLGRTDR